MPVNLHVRNVDERVAHRLKLRAARNGRSAEAEHRALLEAALPADETDWLILAEESRRETAGVFQTPAEVLVRETRDEH